MLESVDVGRIACENVHEILALVILLLDYSVVSSLRDESQEELEFALIQSISHGKHVIVLVVQDQICDTLLTSLDSNSKSASWGSIWLCLDFLLIFLLS